MPVSTSVHISHCLKYIINLRPKSILDIGCGFGMWGFLSRMYLDVSEERVQPRDWKLHVDGIELFEPYIQSHQRALYSNIIIGDIRELAPKVDNYELIIAGDVIEHLDKDDGETVIEHLYEKATRALLVNIPLGEGWEHPERHGNPGELHRSQWYPEDFHPYPSIAESFTLPAGAYGSFFCPKGCPNEDRAVGLMSLADRRRAEGRMEHALKYARKAHEIDPSSQDAAIFLVDLLLQSKSTDEAVDILQNAIDRDAAFHYAYVALAKILRAMNRADEAKNLSQRLLAQPGVSTELRAQAESLSA
ncbi:MAG: tetratricopeptide repeat protein [Candidatus Hydrogenedentes bacterium]|nr:tetratricopeptide repeat protein [Candidatus Hydrogenedentota bacterium]